MDDDTLDDLLISDEFLLPGVDPDEPEDPECAPFAGLANETHPTRRHNRGQQFMSLVAAVHREIQRIPQRFQFVLHLGSASWLGSDERVRRWLSNSDDLTIWKLCYYGQAGGEDKDYAFGVRIRYARQFPSLVRLRCWQFRFQVPPHYGSHQWFVSFSVRATKQSVACIREVIDAVIADLQAGSPGQTNPG